jgi:hypothetical protein
MDFEHAHDRGYGLAGLDRYLDGFGGVVLAADQSVFGGKLAFGRDIALKGWNGSFHHDF